MTQKEKDLLEALIRASNALLKELACSFNSEGFSGCVSDATMRNFKKRLLELEEKSNYLK